MRRTPKKGVLFLCPELFIYDTADALLCALEFDFILHYDKLLG